MNLIKFFQIFILSFVGTAFVGCASPTGYYNPPSTGWNHQANHGLGFDGQFNGQPVLVTDGNPPQYVANERGEIVGVMAGRQVARHYSGRRDPGVKDQMDWYKLAQRQQAQDHREALDRARQQQREMDAQMRRINNGIKSVERLGRTIERFGR